MDIKQFQQQNNNRNKESSNPLDFLNKDISFGNSLGDKKKERFYSELSTLLEAGIDIKASLEIICDQQKGKDRKVFNTLLDEVIKGKSLSESIHEMKEFGDYEYYTIQIGEETGNVAIVLKELGEYYKQSIKQKRQIISALSYPIIVILVAIFAVGFMISFIVPMFADVFKRLDSELPAITKFVVQLSENFPRYATIALVSISIISIVVFWQRKSTWLRKLSSWLILKTPFVGVMLHKIYLSRFATMMNLMISAQIPLLHAIQLIQKMIKFYPLEVSLKSIENNILKGEQLHISMSQHKIFPKRLVSLIRVGEEVNQVGTFFARISKQYREEVEYMSSVLGNLIEPLLLVFLGVVVGFVLVSMYLPLFQLSTAFE